MADGSVLRRGYVAVEPDVTGFDDKLKEKFKRQDPGGKAGRQLGGQLNRALKRLDLDPIDVKADPKKALAAIEVTADRLKLLSANAESVEVKVKTEQAIAQINRFKKQLGDTGAAAEELGPKLGGQLNRALADLDLKPIDIEANPRDALKAIDDTEKQLRILATSAATVEIKVQTEKALGELGSFRKRIGDVGEEAATGFSARFAARLGPLLASAPLNPAGAAIGAAIGVAAFPVVSAAIAGAVVGGAGVGGIAGGLALAARNDEVKAAGKKLGESILGDLMVRSTAFVPAVLGGIARIRDGYEDLAPDIDKIFSSSRLVEPFVDDLLRAGKGFLGGFAEAVEAAEPAVNALGVGLTRIADATGGVFETLAQDADEGASAITDLTSAVSTFITVTGGIIHAGAAVKGFTDDVDSALDKLRAWREDSTDWITGTDNGLDLTADGFEKGTAAAEAYRRATLGTAEAADFATLSQAGMTEAQILAIDASGKYRAQLEQVRVEKEKAAEANRVLVATEDDVKAAQAGARQAQEDYKRSLDAIGVGAGNAAQLVEGLTKATQNLYGAQEAQIDSNESYQSSWDTLSEVVKANSGEIAKNKNNLDIHTEAGRNNRDALQNLLVSSRDLYLADIAAGVATDKARVSHEKRTGAVKEEARRLGLNKIETQKLIATYGKIPPTKTTDLVLDGVRSVVRALENLYIYQRSLATGRSIESVETTLRKGNDNGPAKPGGGYAEGGWTGPGAKWQKAGDVHADEYVIKKESRRKFEAANPGWLDEINATGALPGYAKGGLVAPVDTSRKWTFPTDVSGTRIPSRREVASKVIMQFGNWPSSPAAQRGDSGVWRRVAALIRSTGPLSGSFGNGYRAGDPKWHGSGRAVDWMGYNQDALARFLAARRPLELIHRTRNRDYAYTRGVNKGSFNEALMNAHRNHIHIAMAGGGVIGEPVAGVGLRSGNSYSFGERGPETVTPGVQTPGEPVRLHPADIEALGRVIAREQRTLVGAGAYSAGRRADIFTRGG